MRVRTMLDVTAQWLCTVDAFLLYPIQSIFRNQQGLIMHSTVPSASNSLRPDLIGEAHSLWVRQQTIVFCCRVPVSLEMVEEYDSFCKQFRKAVHENQDQGNLDLGKYMPYCLDACCTPLYLPVGLYLTMWICAPCWQCVPHQVKLAPWYTQQKLHMEL